jgi:UDP-glucose 4-epimerase
VKALVVGGAGFIGSHLVERLVAEAHAVAAVDDLSSGSLGNLAAARRLGGDLTIHSMSVNAPEFGELVALRSPDVIYHLALLPPGRVTPAVVGAQVQGAVAVLEAARVSGAKVVVALPAEQLYGKVPARDVPVKDGHAFDPVSLAGVLARTVVELLVLYRTTDDVEFTALALTSVYGDRQRADGGVVAEFRDAIRAERPGRIRGDGRQACDLLFIDDTVDALARAATRAGGLVVNVGSGVLTPIRELWQLIGHGAPSTSVPPAADEVGRFAVSPTRARVHLEWSPWTTLAEGLAALDAGS